MKKHLRRVGRWLSGAGLPLRVLLLLVVFQSCETGRRAPAQASSPPPSQAPPAARSAPQMQGTPVTAGDRLEWVQDGPSYERIAGYRYSAVVGLARIELKGIQCERSQKGPFVCRADLPPLPPGPHTVRVMATFEGLSSPWSSPLRVFKQE